MENNKLVALLAILLMMIAAYFLGRFISKLLGINTNNENEILLSEIEEKEALLAACNQKNNELQVKIKNVEKTTEVQATSITEIHNNGAANLKKEPNFVPFKKEDLKVVEGIGPKIEELLHNAGILTFLQLANTPVETIKVILEAAGPRYQIHDPSTWPQQSALCAEGKWTALKNLQDELNKGKTE